ncbi:MAG: sigma-70 family RNA polymerase sigma factor [Pseudomonadota bacterium]
MRRSARRASADPSADLSDDLSGDLSLSPDLGAAGGAARLEREQRGSYSRETLAAACPDAVPERAVRHRSLPGKNVPEYKPEVDDDSERALVAAIAQGDKRAFEALFRRHGERIFRYVVRLIGDAGKAEEVTNDVMLEVWKNAGRFEARSKVSTWLLGIARHRALNAVRRKELVTTDIDDAAPVADESAVSGEEIEERAQDADRLRQGLRLALSKLSPDHRDVVELTFFHGCTYQQIAEIAGCPENTVKTRMFHAKKQLRRILVELNLDPKTMEMAS